MPCPPSRYAFLFSPAMRNSGFPPSPGFLEANEAILPRAPLPSVPAQEMGRGPVPSQKSTDSSLKHRAGILCCLGSGVPCLERAPPCPAGKSLPPLVLPSVLLGLCLRPGGLLAQVPLLPVKRKVASQSLTLLFSPSTSLTDWSCPQQQRCCGWGGGDGKRGSPCSPLTVSANKAAAGGNADTLAWHTGSLVNNLVFPQCGILPCEELNLSVLPGGWPLQFFFLQMANLRLARNCPAE